MLKTSCSVTPVKGKVLVTERNLTKISCLSCVCNVFVSIPKSTEFRVGWKAGTSHLLAWVHLVASWFVDEKFNNGICAAFLIFPKVFCIFLSHQDSYPAEAWGGLVMFWHGQSSWGCGQPFALGQCCTVTEGRPSLWAHSDPGELWAVTACVSCGHRQHWWQWHWLWCLERLPRAEAGQS